MFLVHQTQLYLIPDVILGQFNSYDPKLYSLRFKKSSDCVSTYCEVEKYDHLFRCLTGSFRNLWLKIWNKYFPLSIV